MKEHQTLKLPQIGSVSHLFSSVSSSLDARQQVDIIHELRDFQKPFTVLREQTREE